MEINKLVFGGLIAGSLAAAGGGAYLATRHNAQEPGAAGQPGTGPAVPRPAGDRLRRRRSHPPAPAPAPAADGRPAAPGARRLGPAAHGPRPGREAPARARRRLAPAPPASSPPPAPAPANGGSMWETRPAVQPEAPEREAPEPEPVAPARARVRRSRRAADAVLGLQIETTVSSERARVEDAVEARVTRDVRVGGRVAIPAGSIVHGSVTEVDARRQGERARAARHPLPHGRARRRHQLALRTDAVMREGDVARPRERREDRRRGDRRRHPRRHPRRRQGRGDWRRRRRRRRHGGGDGQRSQPRTSRPARPSACAMQQPVTVTVEKE